jgi:DNA-binding NarL/FixJ family response regulator
LFSKLVDKAKDRAGFQFMAEQSFYQWLLNARPRSYASNIYTRMVTKLEEHDDRFHVVHDAVTRQHRGWALVDQGAPAMFAGADRELVAAAMAAGDIQLTLYKPDSKNLDPLVGSDELMRFCEVVMRALGAAATPELLMRALAVRVDLAEIEPDSIDEMGEAGQEVAASADDVDETIDLRTMAINVIAQIINPRWAEVIVAIERRGEAGKDVAARLGVSAATVTSDRKNVVLLVTRSAENHDASRLLKEVVDLLYEASDG